MEKDVELGELISAVRYLSNQLSERNAQFLADTLGKAVKYGEKLANEKKEPARKTCAIMRGSTNSRDHCDSGSTDHCDQV